MSSEKDDMLRSVINYTFDHLERDFKGANFADWENEGWEPDNFFELVKKRYPPHRFDFSIEEDDEGVWARIIIKKKKKG